MPIKDPNFLSEMRGSPVDPSHLESLGKSAAALSDSNEMSLTTAVVQTIGKTKLNAEQVRRVVEFANQTAFERKYASMDPSMRVVDIEGGPADPGRVLQDLNDGARPSHTVLPSSDYMLPPSAGKTASFDCGLGPISVDNSAERGRTLGQVHTMQAKLSAAQEELTLLEGSNRFQMNETLRGLREDVLLAVKTAGLTHEGLTAAWADINTDLMSTAMGEMPIPSQGRGVKVAQVVNPAHPVVAGYKAFVGFAQKYAQATLARKNIELQLVQVGEFLHGHKG